MIRKKDGRILLTAFWKLSKDGNTLKDDYTEFGPDGTSSNVKYVYQRTAGTSGFAGTWEGSSETMNLAIALKVQPYEGDGLSFVNASEGATTNVKFDGKDYPKAGPNVTAGSTCTARQVNEDTLENDRQVQRQGYGYARHQAFRRSQDVDDDRARTRPTRARRPGI